jgi:hypothetical protein
MNPSTPVSNPNPIMAHLFWVLSSLPIIVGKIILVSTEKVRSSNMNCHASLWVRPLLQLSFISFSIKKMIYMIKTSVLFCLYIHMLISFMVRIPLCIVNKKDMIRESLHNYKFRSRQNRHHCVNICLSVIGSTTCFDPFPGSSSGVHEYCY